MANVTVAGASYTDVPAVELPKTGGGTVTFTDVSDTDAVASDVASGKVFYNANGVKTVGTGSGGGGIVIEDTLDSHGGTVRTITAVPVKLQSVAVTPSETAQTVEPDATQGYTGLLDVEVAAIPSDYVGSAIDERDSTDLTASGATVTVPAGYYASAASKAVASGSATAPASISGTSATLSTDTNTLTLSKTISVTPSVSAGFVSSGTAGNSSVSLTASVTTKAATTIHPSTSDQTIASGTYLTGAQTVKAVTLSNLSAENIKSGVTVKVGDSTDDDCVTLVTGTYSGGSAKNVQYVMGSASVHTNGYTSTGMTLTVAKTGTYKISWVGWRSSSQGTMGTNLYKNGTAGTNQQTFTNTYGQSISLDNQSLTADDVLTLYATAGSTTRYMTVANLIIEEQ